MSIDFWSLGLQAVNVLILIWLLSRVFWRPVAAAIATRQASARSLIETARATQAQAEAAMQEASEARGGIAAERNATLVAARHEAEAAAALVLDDARAKAEAILTAARATIAHDTEVAHKDNAERASELSLKIAARLLRQLDGPAVQSAFLTRLVDALETLPDTDRAALVSDPKLIDIVTATDPGPDRQAIEQALREALGDAPEFRFVTDPDLIAGLELRSPHFVLHNSWQADLSAVRDAVKNAA